MHHVSTDTPSLELRKLRVLYNIRIFGARTLARKAIMNDEIYTLHTQ